MIKFAITNNDYVLVHVFENHVTVCFLVGNLKFSETGFKIVFLWLNVCQYLSGFLYGLIVGL